jgi:hypothetical protein
MIREHNPGVDGERVDTTDRSHRLAQSVDVARQQVVAAPLQQIDREKVTSSRHAVTTVVGNRCTFRVDVPILPRPIHSAGHASL